MQWFAYSRGTDGWHRITCNLDPTCDALVVEVMIHSMRNNPVLRHLREGQDYVWESNTEIAFRSLRHAAIFRLLCSH